MRKSYDHRIRIRADIYARLMRRKTREGRIESMNHYIESVLMAHANGGGTLTPLSKNQSKNSGRAGQGSARPGQAGLLNRLWLHATQGSSYWKLGLAFLVLLSSSGCGKFGRKLLGIEPEIKNHYIPMRPDYREFAIAGDAFSVLVVGLHDARYMGVKACDDFACVPLPYHLEDMGKTATFIQDRDLVTFVNLATVFPFATKVRIEYVL